MHYFPLGIARGEGPGTLTLNRDPSIPLPRDEITSPVAPRSPAMLGPFEPFTLYYPKAKPLELSWRKCIERESMGAPDNRTIFSWQDMRLLIRVLG
jgi:hypothetical protein